MRRLGAQVLLRSHGGPISTDGAGDDAAASARPPHGAGPKRASLGETVGSQKPRAPPKQPPMPETTRVRASVTEVQGRGGGVDRAAATGTRLARLKVEQMGTQSPPMEGLTNPEPDQTFSQVGICGRSKPLQNMRASDRRTANSVQGQCCSVLQASAETEAAPVGASRGPGSASRRVQEPVCHLPAQGVASL